MGKRKISLLGSTGSIGTQTLDVIRKTQTAEIIALTANSDVDKIEQQIEEFKPLLCAMADAGAATELRNRLKSRGIECEVLAGESGINQCATVAEADTCLTAIVGIAGMQPTYNAIKCGKYIALANKETLVAAGEIIMEEALGNGVEIFPIDSEHSAIFQCLQGNDRKDVERILLTASGGPFRGFSKDDLKNISAKDALRHPTWNMGAKITIDSATLMNKGLEVIEAVRLFDMPPQKVTPIVHPQSIIHSMVEYKDGSVIAQMGAPDMRVPISLALTWPRRTEQCYTKLNLIECSKLTFEEPDIINFRCLALAYEALKAGGTIPAVMNGANEVCVGLFLKERITFLQIAEIIEDAMNKFAASNIGAKDINDIIEADRLARRYVLDNYSGGMI